MLTDYTQGDVQEGGNRLCKQSGGRHAWLKNCKFKDDKNNSKAMPRGLYFNVSKYMIDAEIIYLFYLKIHK